jgi:hypothetical protein
MKRYRILAWIVPTTMIAGLALAVWYGTAHSPDLPLRDTSASSASRQTPIGEQAASNPQRRGVEDTPPPRPSFVARAEPNKPTGDRPTHAPDVPELAAKIDRKFAQETVDPGWSADAERQLRQALESTSSPGTTLASVSCRRSLCRVESLHTSLEAFQQYVASYMAEDRPPLWNGAVAALVTEQSETRVKAVSFLAKEGSEIPAAEPGGE